MKTKLDTVATAAICKSSWMTCCKVPKCDIIALQEMYDTARKIENNLVMYWCLSRNDKKVTDFRKEMQCVQDVGLSLVRVSFATGVYGCSRECGATDLCWREGGGGGVRPFLFSTENSHIVAHSLTVVALHGVAPTITTGWIDCPCGQEKPPTPPTANNPTKF